jgi:hypothetical protein
MFNCCPVTLLCCLEPFQAILHYAQIHPCSSKVWPGRVFLKKKNKRKNDLEETKHRNSFLCPWHNYKNNAYCICTAKDSSSSASCSSFLSFKIFPRLFMA